MDPSLVVSILATVVALGLGLLGLRKDRSEIATTAHSAETDAAIAGLQAAFVTQRSLTQDCEHRCDDLKTELEELRTLYQQLLERH